MIRTNVRICQSNKLWKFLCSGVRNSTELLRMIVLHVAQQRALYDENTKTFKSKQIMEADKNVYRNN